MNGVVLPGLRADNPMAFLVALGTLDLLTDAGDEPTLAWQPARGTWLATVAAAGATNLETLVDRIHAAHLQRDVDAELDWGSELTKVKRQALRARLAANVADHNRDASLRLAGALAAELPAHGELVRQTPFCLFPILGKRSFLKTVREQTLALSRNDIDTCLRLWRHQRGINTLRLDPSARVQENAIMGPDPSTAGVVGVPAAAPLAIRGLGFYPLQPRNRARPAGFVHRDRFAWPIWPDPLGRDATRLLLACPWLDDPRLDTDRQLLGHGIVARYAARVAPLKVGSMLTWGQREL